jgi:hypothetical protein
MLPGKATAFALKLCLAGSLLTALAYLYGDRVVAELLSMFRAEIEAFDSTFRVHALNIARQGVDTVVRLDVGLRDVVVVGNKALMSDTRSNLSVTTLASNVYQPLLMALSLALAWPSSFLRERAVRVVLALAFSLLVVAMDVPIVLYAELWETLRDTFAAEQFSLAIVWKDFLQGGGRLSLGVATGALAVISAQALFQHTGLGFTNPQGRILDETT